MYLSIKSKWTMNSDINTGSLWKSPRFCASKHHQLHIKYNSTSYNIQCNNRACIVHNGQRSTTTTIWTESYV